MPDRPPTPTREVPTTPHHTPPAAAAFSTVAGDSAGTGAVPAGPPGALAGRYVLQEEIARGGMGIVYRATDPDLNREVALKLIQDRHAAQPAALRRFREEAQITGQLQHPGPPLVLAAVLRGAIVRGRRETPPVVGLAALDPPYQRPRRLRGCPCGRSRLRL
jgi:hypothetical protein